MRRPRFRSNFFLLTRHPLAFAWAYRWSLAILLIGGVLDVVTSWQLLSQFGIGAELHPVGRFFGELVGVSVWTVSAGKLIQIAMAVFVASLYRPVCGCLLVLCGALYTLAAASNHFLWL